MHNTRTSDRDTYAVSFDTLTRFRWVWRWWALLSDPAVFFVHHQELMGSTWATMKIPDYKVQVFRLGPGFSFWRNNMMEKKTSWFPRGFSRNQLSRTLVISYPSHIRSKPQKLMLWMLWGGGVLWFETGIFWALEPIAVHLCRAAKRRSL